MNFEFSLKYFKINRFFSCTFWKEIINYFLNSVIKRFFKPTI
ncbi:hypothetical protein LEP1GSC193_0985 [Leptospira alstonii serovar Pingchang str. 80-412]|uniref:Uncharacterized protein n=2 Tax=Leptospira alstonii TaxID=28452 RepID=M6CJP3_9LEPT|nr:hypothetical protein LEP1GSC194_0677 [Leptospira alstonii serovar Sichuan str. 79601]EQA82369.1 hypothetical protein LEP1GSC193_0985 [Leptospira alstonii serovar Pingchang str. 80-412]